MAMLKFPDHPWQKNPEDAQAMQNRTIFSSSHELRLDVMNLVITRFL